MLKKLVFIPVRNFHSLAFRFGPALKTLVSMLVYGRGGGRSAMGNCWQFGAFEREVGC